MIVDLFAGCGGWDVGARELGMEPVGFEWDVDACRTRAAVGMPTVRCDLATYPTAQMRRKVVGLIASPPCQAFSTAGKGLGRQDPRGALVDIPLAWALALEPEWVAWEQVPPVLPIWREHAYHLERAGYFAWTGIVCAADYGVPQTRRRAILLARKDRRPVPPVPSHDEHGGLFTQRWVSMADALGWGRLKPSSTMVAASGSGGRHVLDGGRGTRRVLRAEQDLGNWVVRTGTNSMKHSRSLDDMEPYERSVARPAPVVDAKAGSAWKLVPGGGGYKQSQRREYGLEEPSPVVAFGNDAAGWRFTLDRRQSGAPILDVTETPAPTVTGTALGKGVWKARSWPYERPATTVAADPRITARCHHHEGSQGANATDVDDVAAGDYDGLSAIRLTVRDALILQSFPADYPVQGGNTAKFRQIGNAVPPLLAQRLLEAVA